MLTITNDQPLRTVADCIVFEAMDTEGLFEIWASGTLWKRLEADASLPADDSDRRDYVLSMIEHIAADSPKPVATASGLRVLLL